MTPERKERLISVLKKRQGDITIVLENVFDPHNISAVMRTCDAIGVQDVYILNTKIPRHKKWGAKSSSSAAKWLTIHQFENAEECFSSLRKNYSTILTTHLSGDAISLHEIDFTKSIALVFGNEHSGVSDEIRALADGNFVPSENLQKDIATALLRAGEDRHEMIAAAARVFATLRDSMN